MLFVLPPARADDPSASDDLFTNQTIRHLQIEVTPAAMESLRGYVFQRDAPRADRPEVLCTVREGANVWTNVVIPTFEQDV